MAVTARIITSFFKKVLEGDENGVRRSLTRHPVLINSLDNNNESALIIASKERYDNIVKLLIEKGANVNLQNNSGDTALMEAYMSDANDVNDDWYNIAKLLIQAGANVNIQNNDGETILMQLLTNGVPPREMQMMKNVKLLIQAGANVNLQDNSGFTAIMSIWDKNIMKLLIENGADVNHQNKDGDTALIYAVLEKNTEEIIKSLIEMGANLNLQNHKGNTPLIAVVDNKYKTLSRVDILNTVEVLTENGADTNIKNNDGQTAYDIATLRGFREIAEYLLNPHSANDTKKLWKGWERGDAEKFNTIFETEGTPPPAANFACCPVCLKFVERSEACMYMSHKCKELGGYYHHELYNTYKTPEGKIYWCTICGRIALGHRHYALGLPDNVTPPLLNAGHPFDNDCSKTNGGGGLDEKLKRFRRLREYALELQDEVGKITEKEALDSLVQEMWKAPLISIRPTKMERMKQNKKYNINSSAFPSPPSTADAVVEAAVANVMRSEANRVNPDLLTEVALTGRNVITFENTNNLIRFRHRQQDGTVYSHKNTELIGEEGLTEYIQAQNQQFGTDEFGRCFAFPDCKAMLYPEEIKGFVPEDVYEEYRKHFNKKFQHLHLKGGVRHKTRKLKKQRIRGGAKGVQVFLPAEASCVLPNKKGGRRLRTTKRRLSKHRKTVRRMSKRKSH